MKTTNAVIEIMIVGIQACVWNILILLMFLSEQSIESFKSKIEGWEIAFTFLMLAGAYTCGVIIDRVADVIFLLLKRCLQWPQFIRTISQLDIADSRIAYLVAANKDSELALYVRTKIRILRSTVLNVLLITLTGALFVGFDKELGYGGVIITIVVGFLVFVPALVSYGILDCNYDNICLESEKAREDIVPNANTTSEMQVDH